MKTKKTFRQTLIKWCKHHPVTPALPLFSTAWFCAHPTSVPLVLPGKADHCGWTPALLFLLPRNPARKQPDESSRTRSGAQESAEREAEGNLRHCVNHDDQVLTSTTLPTAICCAKKARQVGEQSSAQPRAGCSSPGRSLHLNNSL